jgi:hypothetical protein
MTEKVIEKFGIPVTNNESLMMNALSIFAGKYSHISVYT